MGREEEEVVMFDCRTIENCQYCRETTKCAPLSAPLEIK